VGNLRDNDHDSVFLLAYGTVKMTEAIWQSNQWSESGSPPGGRMPISDSQRPWHPTELACTRDRGPERTLYKDSLQRGTR
jgi:hypothetical protein